MTRLEYLLLWIIGLLVLIFWKIAKINQRLKRQFPTEDEEDLEWAKADPLGHYEAHRKDKKS